MEAFLAACVVAGTPLVLATVGELITEKSGSLNLGVEGMMLMGAVMGFVAAYNTGNPVLAILCAALAGAGGALIFALVTVTLRANQTVTGLTLTIFGTGFASFVGQPMIGFSVPNSVSTFFTKTSIPGLGNIPFLGPVLFKQDIFVYFAYVIVMVSCVYMYKTRLGLNMRAVGENAAAADASGINVTLYKYAHIVMGGALCGLGGAYLSLIRVPIWQSDVVTGRGWIAVALVIFASWNPVKALVGAIFFGGLSILGLRLQAMGFTVSQYLVDMIPYVATVIIVIISSHKKKKENQPPADLGNNYFREER
ncbi:ABC transporter permease [Aminipila terrae]|uniref:ABC transporter permease n=1 Tax=Aminipila terrae TaxID=2697030 RepID=A0A6P1MFG7_9FIRM|nr:ABC transporter permease [Aminipila terrae]QHI71913.1 ABC transporter permease [Aminipila terrae]